MARSEDVTAYILEKQGEMSTWKLQKLLYYSQAWHLVWDEEPLFPDRIEAWANGPVVRSIYAGHRGMFSVVGWEGADSSRLKENEAETVEAVLGAYGHLTGRQLSHMTHAEAPWREARGELPATAPSSAEITQESMAAYYSALDVDEASTPVAGQDVPDF